MVILTQGYEELVFKNGGQVYSGDFMVIPKAIITFSLHLSVTLQNHSGNIHTEKIQYSVTDT